MEVHVNDMITKSIKEIDQVKDLEDTFELLRHYGMKLNPKKCTFIVKSRKLLGCMVDQRGIDANPNKVKVMLNMKFPQT